MAEELSLPSPAKVNLRLEVLGRRAGGYHELDTTLLALDRLDTVTVGLRERGRGDVRLTLSGPAASDDVPLGTDNLAVRGATLALGLAREQGRGAADLGLELALEKRIPSRAGLGGGSSNAATACLGAATLLGLDPHDPALAGGLAALGSDCSFFLVARASGLARCRGRGEIVEPLEPAEGERAFCVVTPAVGCATSEVYAAWRPEDARADSGGSAIPPRTWFRAPLDEARAALRNDLEAAALRSHPPLGAWRAFLDEVGAGHFRLCGSGSSFFGLFADRSAAEAFLEERILGRKARDLGLREAFVAGPVRPSSVP